MQERSISSHLTTLRFSLKKIFEKYPKPVTADSAVGTGPFIMKSLEENVGAEHVLTPTTGVQGQPYLDSFRTRISRMVRPPSRAFLAKQFDLDVVVLNGASAKEWIDSQGAGFNPPDGPDDTIGGFFYPNVRQKPARRYSGNTRAAPFD